MLSNRLIPFSFVLFFGLSLFSQISAAPNKKTKASLKRCAKTVSETSQSQSRSLILRAEAPLKDRSNHFDIEEFPNGENSHADWTEYESRSSENDLPLDGLHF